MTPQDEPRVLALLFGIVTVLYLVTWLVSGSPGAPWDALPESAAPYSEQELPGPVTVAMTRMGPGRPK